MCGWVLEIYLLGAFTNAFVSYQQAPKLRPDSKTVKAALWSVLLLLYLDLGFNLEELFRYSGEWTAGPWDCRVHTGSAAGAGAGAGRPGPLLTVGTRANKDATIACLNVLTLRSCTAYQNRDAISLVTGGFVFGMQPIVAGLVATLVQIFLMLRASKVCLFLSTERKIGRAHV